jgi:hypothetical protein
MAGGEASFGFKSSNTKSNSTTNQNRTTSETTTPTIPDFLQNSIPRAYARVDELGGMDPRSLVAGLDPLQVRAGQTAADLGQTWNWDAAADLTRASMMSGGPAQAGAGSSLNALSGFLNPYLDDVVNRSLAAYDAGADETRAQQSLDLAGPFIGSNAAITKAMTEGRLNAGRGQLSADLRSGAYDRAATLANAQADRETNVSIANAGAANGYMNQLAGQRLAAGNQLADIQSGFDADTRSNLAAQSAQGTLFRDYEQQLLSAPQAQAAWQNAQYAGLPGQLFVGQQKDGTDDMFSQTTAKEKTSGFDLGLKFLFP